MTTSAAENTAGRMADKEKVEKRRALGRGLESLLPGPRVVGGAPGQSGAAASKQQVPHFVRNDKPTNEKLASAWCRFAARGWRRWDAGRRGHANFRGSF